MRTRAIYLTFLEKLSNNIRKSNLKRIMVYTPCNCYQPIITKTKIHYHVAIENDKLRIRPAIYRLRSFTTLDSIKVGDPTFGHVNLYKEDLKDDYEVEDVISLLGLAYRDLRIDVERKRYRHDASPTTRTNWNWHYYRHDQCDLLLFRWLCFPWSLLQNRTSTFFVRRCTFTVAVERFAEDCSW